MDLVLVQKYYRFLDLGTSMDIFTNHAYYLERMSNYFNQHVFHLFSIIYIDLISTNSNVVIGSIFIFSVSYENSNKLLLLFYCAILMVS